MKPGRSRHVLGGTAHGLRLLGTFDSAMILEDAR